MSLHPITSWASLIALAAVAVTLVRIAKNLRRDLPRARRDTPTQRTATAQPAQIVGLVPGKPYLRLVVDNTTPPSVYDQEQDPEWVLLRQRSLS